MAGNFTLFVISRIIGGLAKGNVSLSTAVVADVYKSHERGKGMVSLQRLVTTEILLLKIDNTKILFW